MVAELRPDVTLVDVDLGGESGFDVVRRLAEDPRLDAGRLILVSAHAEEDLLDLIEASPAVGFLDKPALSVAAIEWLLDGERGRSGRTARAVGRLRTRRTGPQVASGSVWRQAGSDGAGGGAGAPVPKAMGTRSGERVLEGPCSDAALSESS
jgi:CheY-like chemotaxis protein